jgi:hypothetical protein
MYEILSKVLALAAASFWTFSASAASNSISASIDLRPGLGHGLKLKREGKAFKPESPIITLEFQDPRKRRQIKRILTDPNFFPNKGSYSDFWIVSTLKTRHGKPASETALCDWNSTKTVASCFVECDGGGYEIRAKGTKHSYANFILNLTDRVRIAAEEENCSGEGAAYELEWEALEPFPFPIRLSD